MQRLISVLAMAGVLVAVALPLGGMPDGVGSGAAPAHAAGSPWVSAYYAGYYWDWTGSDPTVAVKAVDMSTMTHLFFAYYAPGAGNLGGSAGQLMPGAGSGHQYVEDPLISKAHGAGVKAIMVIGGSGTGAGWDASTREATTRATFIKNILDKAVAKNYDGVDIDWEDSLDTTPAQQSQLLTLLSELRTAAALRPRYQAPNAPFLITFPGGFVNVNTDLPLPAWKGQVAALVDQYNLMTYSMTWNCCGWQTWLWAPLKDAGGAHPTSIESSIQAYVNLGVPRSKLGIGLGLYGGGYKPNVTGPRQTISSYWGGDDNTHNYRDFYNQGMLSGGIYHWDDAAQAGYYTYSPAKSYRGNNVSMLITEDEQSIAAKGAWVRAGNAGGAIVWTLNYGYINASVGNPPMQAIKQTFLVGGSLPATATPITGATATVTSTPALQPSFTTSATVAPASVTAGGSEVITASVTSATAMTAVVDVEIYSASATKVFQQFFPTESFAAGQQKSYPVTWAVPAGQAAGTYTVKLGLFSTDWAINYAWNDAAASFAVTSGGTPTATATPTNTAVAATNTPVVTVATATNTPVLRSATSTKIPATSTPTAGSSTVPAPTNLNATAQGSFVRLSWTSSMSSGVTYKVYRGNAPGAEILHQTGVAGTRFDDRIAVPGQTYYYQVTAVSPSVESGRSNEAMARLR